MMPWTADVAEPIRVFVLHHFADQFGAVGAQARDDVVDTIDGEHDAADPECVHRNVLGPSSDRFRRVELVQLDPSVAVRSAHQREGSTDVVKADETIDRGAFDGRLTLQLHTELDKERLRSLKVVNHDEDIVHPPNRHGRSPSSSRGPSWPLVSWDGASATFSTSDRTSIPTTSRARRDLLPHRPEKAAGASVLPEVGCIRRSGCHL